VRSHFQFVRGVFFKRFLRAGLCASLLLGVPAASPALRAAEDTSTDVVAHIQGADVSIDDQMLAKASTLASVANGDVVTVHSGQAVLRLVDGGEISICGPARLTVLESSGTLTLALDFGRMHFELPATVELRVLTPSIVATPIEISGGKRDLIVGLDQDDSLCVVAVSGAVQLEQQLSGERLIVPESGDFSLRGGQLTPIADTGQSCKCVSLPQTSPGIPVGPEPETATVIPPVGIAEPTVPENPPQPQSSTEMPSVAVGLLAHANETHPVASDKQPPENESPAVAPPEDAPDYKIILPPVVFSSASPSPPDVPTAETALLVREVHADPDWEFTGHVGAPSFAGAMSQALGVSGADGQSLPAGNGTSGKKPRSFWGSVKHIFTRDAN
jgi:hypothetical protein